MLKKTPTRKKLLYTMPSTPSSSSLIMILLTNQWDQLSWEEGAQESPSSSTPLLAWWGVWQEVMTLYRLLRLQDLQHSMLKVQLSTTYLGVRVTNPEKGILEITKSRLLEQLEWLLVLIIDKRIMISFKVLAAAELNTRKCIYQGQNSSKILGGILVVLLFGYHC